MKNSQPSPVSPSLIAEQAETKARELVDNFRYASPPVQSLRFLEWEPLVTAIASALSTTATPVSPSVVSVWNLHAWTTIDKWLRENPNATAADCLAELTRRIKAETSISPSEVARKAEDLWRDEGGHAWERRANVECVECPHCCFIFAAIHGDGSGDGYSCPNCEGCPEAKPAATVPVEEGDEQPSNVNITFSPSATDAASGGMCPRCGGSIPTCCRCPTPCPRCGHIGMMVNGFCRAVINEYGPQGERRICGCACFTAK